jgi:hypothetical protein
MAPVAALIVNPAGEAVYVPPAVPVRVTFCTVALLAQKGPAYEIVALGAVVMVTLAVVVNAAQPPAAAIVYVTVYVPAVEVLGVTAPVAAFNVNPAGVAVNVPPVVPVIVTACAVAKLVQ